MWGVCWHCLHVQGVCRWCLSGSTIVFLFWLLVVELAVNQFAVIAAASFCVIPAVDFIICCCSTTICTAIICSNCYCQFCASCCSFIIWLAQIFKILVTSLLLPLFLFVLPPYLYWMAIGFERLIFSWSILQKYFNHTYVFDFLRAT